MQIGVKCDTTLFPWGRKHWEWFEMTGYGLFRIARSINPANPCTTDFYQQFHNDTGILITLQYSNTPRIHKLTQHNMSGWPRKAHSPGSSANASPSRYATKLTQLLQLLQQI